MANDPESFKDRIELYCSDAAVVPQCRQDADFIGYLDVDLSRVVRGNWEKKQVKTPLGKTKTSTSYLVKYKIEMVLESREGILRYKVVSDGSGTRTVHVGDRDLVYSRI